MGYNVCSVSNICKSVVHLGMYVKESKKFFTDCKKTQTSAGKYWYIFIAFVTVRCYGIR